MLARLFSWSVASELSYVGQVQEYGQRGNRGLLYTAWAQVATCNY